MSSREAVVARLTVPGRPCKRAWTTASRLRRRFTGLSWRGGAAAAPIANAEMRIPWQGSTRFRPPASARRVFAICLTPDSLHAFTGRKTKTLVLPSLWMRFLNHPAGVPAVETVSRRLVRFKELWENRSLVLPIAPAVSTAAFSHAAAFL